MPNEWTFPDAQRDDLPTDPHPETLPSPGLMRVSPRTTDDAVVVVPGIMGTELIDSTSGKKLWGLEPSLLARMWLAPTKALAPLAVGLAATTVKPGRLLRVPTFAPFLAGAEPYTELVERLHGIVRHPSAVFEFGYDWRLSVRHNARLLAEAIDSHLTWWRARSDRPEARVHIVAHSMGGLLCHELATLSGATDDVSTVITLGTPFAGAAKSTVLLNSGHGTALPARRLQQIAITMPGVYDLLPTYRCLHESDSVRRLTSADIANIGGRDDLAQAALDRHAARAPLAIPRHRPLIGVEQPTISSVSITSGRVDGLYHTFRVDEDGGLMRRHNGTLKQFDGLGDGTVPRNSAVPLWNPDIHPLPQQHGPVAKTDEAIAFVIDTLMHRESDLGPRLGHGDLGILPPDIVSVGVEFDVLLSGAHTPSDVRAVVTNIGTREGRRADTHRRDGTLMASATVYEPGLYRVAVASSGNSAVSQIIMAIEDESINKRTGQ
ncbi:esterase/lipase family protein [Nocardia gipuzkoensis]